MSKKKKEKPIIARRRIITSSRYEERMAEREAARAKEMNLMIELTRAKTAAFVRIVMAMERIADSLEPLTITANVCTCQPKTRKKVKPNV